MLWSPNLQLYYPFENQANDYSGNARHGTVFGSGVYATRPNAGRCLYFDGTGDYVATPSFGLPATHTVVWFAAWVRCKFNATINQHLFGDPAHSSTVGFFQLYRVLNTNTLRWRYADGAGDRITDLANCFTGFDDVWVHVAVVCDYAGAKCYFYRGASLLATNSLIGTPVFPSTNRVKYLGSNDGGSNLLTDGYLCGVQLGTLETCPPVAVLTANANRLMLGMNPIW